ncbi:MBL fold metallo-hydrolase [Actinoallomurus iriomotensis]|uniref:MBL fold metallo-hydrolase n=1 Tax=Actinoallomurus iriomotensis TaxID=478107 RepID=UPI002554D0FA|nr:MBL fold metallo-hydrolase [Actinoallomurus iriomotensis]
MTSSATGHGERLLRPSTMRSLRLGDLTLTYVPDGAVWLNPRAWFPGTTDEAWAAHPEYLNDSGQLVAGVGALLVERGERALLIDTGFGPQSVPARPGNPRGAIHGGALLDNLAALGRAPAEIEAVAFTHLHLDHIGWAWHSVPGRDRPPFAGSDHLVAEAEWAQRHRLRARGVTDEILQVMSPRVRTVTDGQEVFPGVRVLLTPGHTSGHAGYVIRGGGRRLIAFGDAMHSPIQVDHPEWPVAVDLAPGPAARQRGSLVAELAMPDTIGFGVHFADVVFGRVHRDGDRSTWRPVDR